MEITGGTPVITIFVRHAPGCKYEDDETWKRCNCRKHLRWTQDGKQYRRSAKTRSWATAEDVRAQLAQSLGGGDGPPAGIVDRPTIRSLVEVFAKSKETQGLNPQLAKRYRLELTRLVEFLEARGCFLPRDITLSALYEFRATWPKIYPAPLTQQKVQERIRGFLRFLHDDGHIAKIPRLSPIKVSHKPRMPLTEKQYKALLAAVPETFEDKSLAQRVRAAIRLMRHSGLAIGDAVTLERAHLQHDKEQNVYRVVTSRQKTGTHVSVPIPDDLAKELLAVANGNPQYVFWDYRGGKKRTVAKDWQKDFRRVFVKAGLEEFSSHCLRDTFSVDLLNRRVPLEFVAKALGHSNPATTAKYYAPWVKSRQDGLDALMLPMVKKAG